MEWAVKRRFPRHAIQLPILYKLKSTPPSKARVGRTKNLSEGGACLELEDPLPPRTGLAFVLWADLVVIQAEAEVVWVGDPTPPGHGKLHGIRFTQLTSDHHRALLGLFPEGRSVQRRSGRIAIDLPVTCWIGGDAAPPLHGRVKELSRGMFRLLLPHALPLSTDLHVAIPDVQKESWAEDLVLGLVLRAI